MPIDLHDLDLNFDHHIDTHELQMFELAHHGDFSLHDLNHDNIFDHFQNDLNHDMQIDQFQADLDHNGLIDRFETQLPGDITVDHDFQGDGNIDYIDTILAKNILGK